MNQKIKKNFKTLLIFLPSLMVGILFTILPLLKTLQDSFTVLVDKYNYNITSFGIKNYNHVLEDPLFKIGFVNTTFLIFIIAPIFLIIFFMIAFLLNTLSFKIFKNSFIAIIFIQFFISSYAIGIVFMVLFSDKYNVLNSIFKTDTSFGNDNQLSAMLSLSIFFVWRTSVISLLLFTFSINKINKKYILLGKLDKLNFIKKICIIYIPNIKNTIYILIYVHILSALFIYPTFYQDAYLVKGQTIMYYIIDKFNDPNHIQWSFASAASICLFLYSIFIIFLIFISKKSYSYFIKKIIRRWENGI